MELSKIKRLVRPILIPFWWIYVVVGGVIAVALGLAGIGAGIYVGGWVMLLGGFADAINLFKGYEPVVALDLAVVFAKIIFAIPIGAIIAGILVKPAGVIVESLSKKPWFAKSKGGESVDARMHES